VPDSDCTIATDRLYSLEHVWVKSISSDLAVIGITSTMVKILYEPFSLSMLKIGDKIVRDDGFGVIEGYKTMAVLISPVSGTVVDVNKILEEQGRMYGPLALIIFEPYKGGWMLVVRLDRPDDLKSLMTPESYLERLGKA